MSLSSLSGPGRPPVTSSNARDQLEQPISSPGERSQVNPNATSEQSSSNVPEIPQSSYQEDMGGLAALVHAAAQEQRRLSGGTTYYLPGLSSPHSPKTERSSRDPTSIPFSDSPTPLPHGLGTIVGQSSASSTGPNHEQVPFALKHDEGTHASSCKRSSTAVHDTHILKKRKSNCNNDLDDAEEMTNKTSDAWLLEQATDSIANSSSSQPLSSSSRKVSRLKDEEMDVDVEGALADLVSGHIPNQNGRNHRDTPESSTVDPDVENELLTLVSYSVQPQRAARKKKELEKAQEKLAATKGSAPVKEQAIPQTKSRPKAKAAPKARPKAEKKSRTPLPTSVPASRPKVDSKVQAEDHVLKNDDTRDVSMTVDQSDVSEEDTKLYCVCKTLYEAERIMIACDRCDEWYHPPCVGMPEEEVEVVDQFFCPVCVKGNPNLSLETTYKARCFRTACNKPARGNLSKYCSDSCGIQTVNARLETWGGNKAKLWSQVQNAAPREGVVCVAGPDGQILPTTTSHADARRSRADEERQQLGLDLDDIVKEREIIKTDVQVITWRQQAIEMATARAVEIQECGWDQRLCFGTEEYEVFGEEVLASYQEAADEAEGDWFCRGKYLKCERHAGWQTLRSTEAYYEKELKDAVLQKLTTREREVRKRIEDLSINP